MRERAGQKAFGLVAMVGEVVGQAVIDERGRGIEDALSREVELAHGGWLRVQSLRGCTMWYVYQLVQSMLG